MKVGFLGCGVIAKALIEAIQFRNINLSEIAVTQRSEGVSAELKKKYPNQIEVYEDTQTLLDSLKGDKTAIVFLSVRPEHLEAVEALDFQQITNIVTLLSTVPRAEVAIRLRVSDDTIVKAVPMPPIQFGLGSMPVIESPNKTVMDFLRKLSPLTIVSSETDLHPLQAMSCQAGTFYRYLQTLRDHCIAKVILFLVYKSFF
jgi:pyrroline-5-carboxylate reductase